MTPFDRPSIALKHVEPISHVESPDSKRRIHSLVQVSGLGRQLDIIDPFPAGEEALLRFHTLEYLEKLRSMSNREGGDAGECTPFSPGAYEIALLSCGGVIAAAENVVRGVVKNAYALVRPPGHHAERDRGRGFCMLSNVAVATMHIMAEYKLDRVAIIDWDVHHGNGTQQAFWESRNVLFVSVHQDRQYPLDTGMASETGEGVGKGSTLNIPLPPGCGHGAYLYAMEMACKAAEAHNPELIIVSCGFDAAWTDPLGAMMCHSGTFREMTRMVRSVAERKCSGKLLMVHEGGYSSLYAPFCGLAVMEELTGIKTEVSSKAESCFPRRPLCVWGCRWLNPRQMHQILLIWKTSIQTADSKF